jgi:hypothetical protein
VPVPQPPRYRTPTSAASGQLTEPVMVGAVYRPSVGTVLGVS